MRIGEGAVGEAPGNADVPVGIFPFVADGDVGVPRSLPHRALPQAATRVQFRPACFAAYTAMSAALISASGAGNFFDLSLAATPMLTVTGTATS